MALERFTYNSLPNVYGDGAGGCYDATTLVGPSGTVAGIGPTSKTVTISSGQSLSGSLDTEGYPIKGIIMPASWDTANLTFQASVDGTNWFNLYDDNGNEVVIQAAANRAIAIDSYAGSLAPFRYLKIQSGTSATPVNQTANRVLTVGLLG